MDATEYDSMLTLAAALEAAGDCMAALNEYERAIKTNHKRPEAYLEAAKMLIRHDGIWESHQQVVPANRGVQYLEHALNQDMNNLPALELLFRAQMHVGELYGAVQTASKLMDLSPDSEHWRQQGQRAFATLEKIPHKMNLLAWQIGPEGINKLRKKLVGNA